MEEVSLMEMNVKLLSSQIDELGLLYSDAFEVVDGSESLLLEMKPVESSNTLSQFIHDHFVSS